jgi:hypothetical protein
MAGAGAGLNFDFATLVKAKPGAWADYTMARQGGTEKPVSVRYSVVERTPAKVALEVDTTTPKGDLVIHFDFGPTTADLWRLTGGTMQMGDQKVAMPMAQIASAPPVKASDPPGDFLGVESVTTPAGTFSCKHYKKVTPSADAKSPLPPLELWINDKVSPTGLVKSTITGTGIQMTLAGTGTGAQSKVK